MSGTTSRHFFVYIKFRPSLQEFTTIRGEKMPRLYTLHRAVCPFSGRSRFHRRKGFHPLGRFKCYYCGSAFFRAKIVRQRR
jgi:hypothetical protein